jgi:hypothetical protein
MQAQHQSSQQLGLAGNSKVKTPLSSPRSQC